ncbi:CCA tRNA nucleotidyltransferase [Candidatus Liberibacter americanus]|uniref:tRNA nucleotidyltransferase/poly(A) polymerase n=1 Tax=Candidatus Liberibacter americanus str. Sao Paulo TaxID=1261131 RepID=U6B8W6_9HYPH|nr:CCA tRNA nucleotidyltransferase [Candidatus Liberibacter americanus]AHA28177.1 tRNA nucleotidyltransferase/poly(A) polymerase [Candidatus Liberibacter americanus str. Sao Paulo]EMS35851.1 poly(A) polymerase [Candidatus Liberibacter americanus PW_SP]
MVSVAKCKWFCDPDLIYIMSLLNQGNEKSCIVGGAVRDSLMNVDVKDVDIATTILPDVVIKIFSKTKCAVIPKGIYHGTVTVLLSKKCFDITTLRSDYITDGRNAKVIFTKDWHADALRRDFTINALYADRYGQIIDYVGGLNDIRNNTIRFIGNAHHRIEEDYLRILRFFRFFAHYGKDNIDFNGFSAIKQTKVGLKIVSIERIWSEIKKLLEAKNPIQAVIHMHDSGVFKEIFPYIQCFHIDKFSFLIEGEQKFKWSIDPLLRFIVLIYSQDENFIRYISKKLCLSTAIKHFFLAFIQCNIPINITEKEIIKLFYIYGSDVVIAKLKIFLALNHRHIDNQYAYKIIKIIEDIPYWRKPIFPLRGYDVLKLGINPGKKVGYILDHCKDEWINSFFQLSRKDLLNILQELIKSF